MNETQNIAPRFLFPSVIMEKYELTQSDMIVLTREYFPEANADAVLLVLAICKLNNVSWKQNPVELMPFNKRSGSGYETTYRPVLGIKWWRMMANKSGHYMGCEPTEFGPKITVSVDVSTGWGQDKRIESKEIEVYEWACVTINKLVNGHQCKFAGPRIAFKEYLRTKKDGSAASTMQVEQANQMLEKTAEVGALRKAFYAVIPGEDEVIQSAANDVAEHMSGPAISRDAVATNQADALGYDLAGHKPPEPVSEPVTHAPPPTLEKPEKKAGKPKKAPPPPEPQETFGETPPEIDEAPPW